MNTIQRFTSVAVGGLLAPLLLFGIAGCPKKAGDTTAAAKARRGPAVLIKTSMGDITVQLDLERAPVTVKNFLRYVRERHYDGTVFHRVKPEFMIQGGGYTKEFVKKPTHAPIRNEATNGLQHHRGTVAMARTSEIHSASAQFFINVVDNDFLNHKSEDPKEYGYAVFGRVTRGMDVVDKIRNVPTGAGGPFKKDCPLTAVVILSVRELPQGGGG